MGIEIRLQPKQQLLSYLINETDVDIVGGGGSRGGAKSGGGRRIWIQRRFDYARTNGLIMRGTFGELNKSHIEKFKIEFPELASWYNSSDHQVNFPNGSILYFGSADREERISQFYSAEMADIMVDEAQEFSQAMLEKLGGSNRCTTNPRIQPKRYYAFMPGVGDSGLPPIGLEYLKRVFIDKKLQPEEKFKKWAFVPVRAWDNIEWVRPELNELGIGLNNGISIPHLTDSYCQCQDCVYYSWEEDVRTEFFLRSNYGRNLQAMARDKELRAAWIYGTFGTFQGKYFTQWDPARHVITAAEARERIKPWHKKWASEDWGFGHPVSAHWHSQDEHGRVITYREHWAKGQNEPDCAFDIASKSGWDGRWKDSNGEYHGEWKRTATAENLQAFPISWDAGKQSPRSDKANPKSFMQMQAENLPSDFPQPFPADSSPGTRIAGARLLSNLLDATIAGMPAWQVSEDCVHLIECMPTLMKDPDNPEDVLKVDYSQNQIGDDPYDDVRMGLQFMLGSAVIPVSVVAERRVAAYAQSRGEEVEDMDINTLAQLHRRAMIQEQRKRHQRKGGLGRVWRPQNR